MKLIHLSDKKSEILDPKHHGSGVKGAESKRKINDALDWVDRTYYYKHDTKPESLLAGKRYIHHVDVPEEKLYDFRNDPDKLSEKTRWLNGALNATAYEKAIKDAGYLGYNNGGHMDNIVVIFHPLKPHTIEDKHSLEKAKKDEQKKAFGSYGSKKGLPKYLEVVENFARNKFNIEPVRVTPANELEKLYGKPIKDIPDEVKAEHNWKKAGSTGNYIAKPSFFKKDGKWHVTHLGTPKSLIHELAHIIRGNKNIPDLDQAMQRGFGAIKAAGLKAGKEAKAQGATEEELKQARKKSNQFAWPGEYETMGLEQMIARHLGLPANTTHAYVEGEDKPAKDVQVSMKTGEPIHLKVPAGEGKVKHISHLSQNVPPKLKEKFDKFISGQIKFHPDHGWSDSESINAKINRKIGKISKALKKNMVAGYPMMGGNALAAPQQNMPQPLTMSEKLKKLKEKMKKGYK